MEMQSEAAEGVKIQRSRYNYEELWCSMLYPIKLKRFDIESLLR